MGTWRALAQVLVVAAIGAVTADAGGQTPGSGMPPRGKAAAAPDPNLPERPLQEALDESIGRHRLLVVVTSSTREKEKQNRRIWSNPGLQRWISRYGVLVHVSDQKMIEDLRKFGTLVVGIPEQPLLFRAGKQERIFGSTVREDGGIGGERLRDPPPPSKEARKRNEDRPDTSLRLMMRLEWTRRSFQAKDAAWWQAHERINPPTQPPQVPYAAQGVPDERGESTDAPSEVWKKPDPLSRFLASMSGFAPNARPDPAAITERWTWLWERGAVHTEPFAAASISTLAREWHALGQMYEPAMERARRMRDAEAALIPWMDDAGLFTWIMLSRIADEHVEALDFLDSALDDPDSRLMMSPGQRAVIEMMLPWANWADPGDLPGASGDRLRLLKSLRDRLAKPRPQKVAAEEWARVQQFGGWLMRAAGARVYAALLASGQDERAAEAVELVAGAAGAGQAAEWLVTGALAERQAREEQLKMLKRSTTPWARRLEELVKEQLAAQAK